MSSITITTLVFLAFVYADDTINHSLCKTLETCNRGGSTLTCNITKFQCPPCVAFDNNGCFETLNGVCPFGFNCADAWNQMKGLVDIPDSQNQNQNSDQNKSRTAPTPSDSNSSSSVPVDQSKNANAPTPSSTPVPQADKPASSGSNMSVIFAIIGAAIGVIAVAIIFLTLVRRSRAADEDDGEVITSPEYKTGSRQSEMKPPVNFSQINTANDYDVRSGSSFSSTPSQVCADSTYSSTVANYYNQSRPISSPGHRRSTIGVARPAIPSGPSRQLHPMVPAPIEVPSSLPGPTAPLSDTYNAEYRAGTYHQNIMESPRSRRESYEF